MQKSHLKFVAILIGSIIFLFGCFGSNMPEPHSLPYDALTFDKLAKQIVKQNKIYEMDDFTRHFKKVNNILIRLYEEIKESDDSTNYFIDRIIDSLKLDKESLNQIREQLEKTKLREFHKSGDSILFIADGFLGSSWGFFYTDRPSKMDSIPFTFQKIYIDYVSPVNEHWRKVGLYY